MGQISNWDPNYLTYLACWRSPFPPPCPSFFRGGSARDWRQVGLTPVRAHHAEECRDCLPPGSPDRLVASDARPREAMQPGLKTLTHLFSAAGVTSAQF